MSAASAEKLRRAKSLIDTPDKWIKGDRVRVVNNQRCYCAVGALEMAGARFRPLVRALPGGSYTIVDFNDAPTTTHADVMALFDRAIAAEEADA